MTLSWHHQHHHGASQGEQIPQHSEVYVCVFSVVPETSRIRNAAPTGAGPHRSLSCHQPSPALRGLIGGHRSPALEPTILGRQPWGC